MITAIISPNDVYATNETRKLLKISRSTIKRLLRRGPIRTNKVGGQYRILEKEIIKLVLPNLGRKSV